MLCISLEVGCYFITLQGVTVFCIGLEGGCYFITLQGVSTSMFEVLADKLCHV